MNYYNDLNELCALWLALKHQRRTTTERMHALEEQIKILARIPDEMEGIYLVSTGSYTIKVVNRDYEFANLNKKATTNPKRLFFTITKED